MKKQQRVVGGVIVVGMQLCYKYTHILVNLFKIFVSLFKKQKTFIKLNNELDTISVKVSSLPSFHTLPD